MHCTYRVNWNDSDRPYNDYTKTYRVIWSDSAGRHLRPFIICLSLYTLYAKIKNNCDRGIVIYLWPNQERTYTGH